MSPVGPGAAPRRAARPAGDWQAGGARPAGRIGARPPALSGWAQGQPADQREQNGRQWRDTHRGWGNTAVWEGHPNWWRGNRAFNGYAGIRLGFFFVPSRGYIRAPLEYEHRYWAVSEILPEWFWQYGISDYDAYGLPQPPDGCVWVWADDDVILIDRSDGYIIDVVRSVW